MAKFITRLFSRGSSFRGSQSSLNETQNRSKTTSSIRSGGSLENLASYHITSKELEKNKLHKASWDGSVNKVDRLAQPGQINVRDPKGRTALHLAVVKGHLGIVERLVEKEARLDIVDADQRTPLIKAVVSGTQNPQVNLKICKVLLRGGADNSINSVDKDGKSALHYAISYGNEDLVELLLSCDKCDPDLIDRDQWTPLHLAIKRNRPRVVELLLSDQHDQQADPNLTDRNGETPLHIAAKAGYIEIVRLLLTANLSEPCDPRITDSLQLTALQAARASGAEPCAKLIEEYQQYRFKPDLQRQTTISIHEPTSAKVNSSISMIPASNLEHDHDDTSDDSASVLSHKPLKSFPRRTKRESDQWSDDNSLSLDQSKSDVQRIKTLFKNNPLQPEQTKKPTPSTVSQLLINNPLQARPKKTPVPLQPTSSGPFYGIGPVIERVDSDNTSTSVSVKKLIQLPPQKKPSAVPHPVSTLKSWSDDTTSAPPAKQKAEPRSNSWDTSVSDDDDATISKSKEVPKTLQKPLAISTSIIGVSSSDTDDDDSFDTEIRRLDLDKPSSSKGLENLVNKAIGGGYKVVGVSEVQSPVSEDSSWSTSLVPFNQPAPAKPVETVVQADDSTWDDDSRPLTDNRSSKPSTTGVENLTKIMNGVIESQPKPPANTAIGKLVVSSMADRTDSELTPRHSGNERKKSDEWSSTTTTTEKKLKTPQLITRDSYSSFAETQLKELKESIRRLEENQDDTRELKRQLHEVEIQKHNIEKLHQENGLILRDIKSELEHEKNEKHRFESTTKNLNDELKTIRQKLQESEDRKHQLNQRCLQLEHERDQQDNQLHTLETTRLHSHEEDIEKVQSRYREDLKALFAENEELHRQKKELQSDLELHKDTIDVTVRYKLDLQKAIDEKTFFQREFDRLKQEKDQIEQERLEYKSKYDGLQDEIRMILSDRSKLEQKLTEELQEHFREKQHSTDHSNQYRLEIEQLNLKLTDAEARLLAFDKQNQTTRHLSAPHPLSVSLDVPSNVIHEENGDLNQTYPRENYLVQNTRLIRSNTQRVKSELERLREDFDRLVSNYEPNSNAEQQQTELRLKIETFRQFYEQEFRQRQLISTEKSNTRLFPSAMETTRTERRSPTISQLPRQASALLTMNKSGIS